MKIVEEKKIRDFRQEKHVCCKCKSILEIEVADLKVAGYMYPIGPTDTKLGFGYNCPVCNCFNWIYAEDTIPDDLKEKLLNEYQKKHSSSNWNTFNILMILALILILVTFIIYFATIK